MKKGSGAERALVSDVGKLIFFAFSNKRSRAALLSEIALDYLFYSREALPFRAPKGCILHYICVDLEPRA